MTSAAHAPTGGWRIIVTDDDTSKLTALTGILRDAGHCVFPAYDGRSAIELMAALPGIDLLISDTKLGIVAGPELMRRSRALRPNLSILHVIHAGDADGATPPDVVTLREPFTPTQLLMVVGSLLA
jgi:DNA-binding response OmpR family regulator